MQFNNVACLWKGTIDLYSGIEIQIVNSTQADTQPTSDGVNDVLSGEYSVRLWFDIGPPADDGKGIGVLAVKGTSMTTVRC